MIVPCNDKHIKNIFYSFNINIWSPSFQSYEPSLYRSINYLFKLLYGVIRVYITIKNHTYICHTLIFLVYYLMNDFTTLAWSNLSKQGHDQGLCHTWVKVTHIPKNRKEVQHSIYIIHNKTSLKKIFKFSDEIY